MRILFSSLFLVLASTAMATELMPVAEVLAHMQSRFDIRFIYPGDILVTSDGSPATLAIDPAAYRQEELFAMLQATLTVAIEPVPQRPRQYVITPQARVLARRISALGERLAVVERQQAALIESRAEQDRQLRTILEELRSLRRAVDAER